MTEKLYKLLNLAKKVTLISCPSPQVDVTRVPSSFLAPSPVPQSGLTARSITKVSRGAVSQRAGAGVVTPPMTQNTAQQLEPPSVRDPKSRVASHSLAHPILLSFLLELSRGLTHHICPVAVQGGDTPIDAIVRAATGVKKS